MYRDQGPNLLEPGTWDQVPARQYSGTRDLGPGTSKAIFWDQGPGTRYQQGDLLGPSLGPGNNRAMY